MNDRNSNTLLNEESNVYIGGVSIKSVAEADRVGEKAVWFAG